MVHQEFVVWEWLDVAGDPIYVGWGKWPVGRKDHPATVLFKNRKRQDTDLNVYLRTLDAEPTRSKRYPDTKMYRQAARQECYSRRKELRKKGYTLFSTRPYGTTLGGGGARVVRGPKGEKYASVREAARAVDKNPCTITRYCSSRTNGWRYLT